MFSYLVHPSLYERKRRKDEGMDGEKDVICADEVLLTVVPALVFLLDLGAEEEGQVENLRTGEKMRIAKRVADHHDLSVRAVCLRIVPMTETAGKNDRTLATFLREIN